MPKLRVLSGREVCALLAAHGFVEVRRRGSHVVMQRAGDGGSITVPVPDHAEIRIGTLLRSCARAASRGPISKPDSHVF